MLERVIEKYLVDSVRDKLKGIAYKFTSPGRRAVPDRICIVEGDCFFVECKATSKFLTDAQEREARRLRNLDQWVYMANSKSDVNDIIYFWEQKLKGRGVL